ALGLYYRVDCVDISKVEIDINALKLIDLKTAFNVPCIPYEFSNRSSLKIAVPNPRDCEVLDSIRFRINYHLIPVFAYEKDIVNEVRFYSSQFK
ncbi:MAG: hypothetical protein ACRENO_09770, partial [Thermodesulfobacteriota bacterium]